MLLKSNPEYQKMSRKCKIHIEGKLDEYVDLNRPLENSTKIAEELLAILFLIREKQDDCHKNITKQKVKFTEMIKNRFNWYWTRERKV